MPGGTDFIIRTAVRVSAHGLPRLRCPKTGSRGKDYREKRLSAADLRMTDCPANPGLKQTHAGCRLAPLIHEAPCIAKQPHPAAVFSGLLRPPRILRVTERALRVRHDDGEAAVGIAERRKSEG